MSNYIDVLRRLEQERGLPEAAPSPTATPSAVAAPRGHSARAPAAPPPSPTPPVAAGPPEPIVAGPVTRPLDTRRSHAFATATHPGIATLLDNIRMLSSGRASRVVVFCGASTAEAVTTLASALAAHAEQSGMKAFVGTLTRTTRGTVVAPAADFSTVATTLEIDLNAGSSTAELQGWVERVAPNSDLVVLTGPPLATSIDAALLACACDGLVIVAESEVTERATLQIAAERARIAGCRTLGVVMHGTKDRLPGWIHRLMGDRSDTHSVRED
jgi:Mrp family chromosome partitioning ATPase